MNMRSLGLVLLCLAAAPDGAAAQAAAAERVLVVPFDNAQKDPRIGWLGEAAAVLLADELNARGVPAIRRTERVRAFEQLHLPLSATLSRATVIKVGQLVGASEVVTGSYRVENDLLSVEAHSIRIDVGRLQPHVTERAPLKDLFGTFQRVAGRLSSGGAATAAAADAARAAQPPLVAFESYIKGLIAENAATQATFLESAIREHASFDRARLALWDVRHEQADHAAALAVARSVPDTSALAARARFRAGVSLMELKRYDEAFETLKALLDAAPAPRPDAASDAVAPILNNLGVVLIRRGATAQTGSPAYYLTKAADADPGEPDYRFNLGYAYALMRNYQGAVYWLRETVRRNPADADAHYVLAAALQANGSPTEASRERELARQLSADYEDQGDKPIPLGLERVRTELDVPRDRRIDDAIVNSAQREQQDLARFHLDSGRRLFQREQDRDAMAELRRVVYLLPYEAEAHLLIGRIHLRAGRPQEAVDALKISIWSQDTAAARVALAEAYISTKDSAAARAELDRALALDPASADARRLLGSLQ